jgi:DNA-binding MarR family transcriptional regulator
MSRKPDGVLTTNARILLVVYQDPRATDPEIADRLEIEKSSVLRGRKELRDQGYLSWSKSGRGNKYRVHVDEFMIPESRATVDDLMKLLRKTAPF